MKARYIPLLFVTTVVGCSNALPYQAEDLLTINAPVVSDDAVYFLSPAGRVLVEVIPGAQAEDAPYTDLEAVTVNTFDVPEGAEALQLTPDGAYLVGLAHGLEHHLILKRPGLACEAEGDEGCPQLMEARPLHDELVFSPDGRFAITYISAEAAAYTEEAVVNLNEIAIYDFSEGSVSFATIGFAPHNFAFTSDGQRMVALTAARVVAVDLVAATAQSRELTLGTDSRVTPSQVVITGDDRFAFVTVEGSADLYTFDLTQESLPINILGLSGVPRAMQIAQSGEKTLLLTQGGARLDVISHSDLAVSSQALPTSADHLLVPEGGDYAVAFDVSGGGHSLHIIDIETERARTYLLDNPCTDVKVSPGAGSLVLYYRPDNGGGTYLDNSYAVAILNLAQGDRQPNPVLTATEPGAAAFRPGQSLEGGQVFVALSGRGASQIARIDLSNYGSTAVETAPYARWVTTLEADGRVIVVHNSAVGLISIFNPGEPENIQFIEGFLTHEIF